jgi:hypothetical protein
VDEVDWKRIWSNFVDKFAQNDTIPREKALAIVSESEKTRVLVVAYPSASRAAISLLNRKTNVNDAIINKKIKKPIEQYPYPECGNSICVIS